MASLATRFKLLAKAAVGTFDNNSATQAFGMLSGIHTGTGEPVLRGTKDILGHYSRMPWLRAVSSRIGDSVATSQWVLYVPKNPGARRAHRDKALQRAPLANRKDMIRDRLNEGTLQRIDNHILLDGLDRANSFQTGHSFRKISQIHLDLVGETFWLKERNGVGAPEGFWPLPPHWVEETPTPDRRTFRVSFRGWQGDIPDTEILWMADPDPQNPFGRGSGLARTLADELETDEFSAKFTRQVFVNNARPDFVVWPESGEINDAQRNSLRNEWLSQHQGFWRAFRPMFASRKVGLHEFKHDFKALQLIELREYERNCYDEKTECLTRRGWVGPRDLRDDDEVATWNELWQRMEYRVPTEIVRQNYSGLMHYWKNERVDASVTPNHRMYVTYPELDDWHYETSETCRNRKSRTQWRITGRRARTGNTTINIPTIPYVGHGLRGHEPEAEFTEYDTTVFGRWLGYWLAEGSLTHRTNSNGDPNRFGLNMGQSSDPGTNEPIGVAADMISATEALDSGDVKVHRKAKVTTGGRTMWSVEVSNKSLWAWVLANCGDSSQTKRLPRCVFEWHPDAQEALLNAFVDGDGHRYETGYWASTSSPQLADDLQELGLLLGLRTSIGDLKADGTRIVNFSHRELSWVKSASCSERQYEGLIWCVDVGGGAFFTRRNGKVACHGNTIIQVFGFPPEILGVIENSNRSTIDAAGYLYDRYVHEPRLEFLRTQMQERLIPEYDDRLIIDYVSPVREDMMVQLDAMKTMPYAFTINELRKRGGEDPLQDPRGDLHAVPSGMSFATDLASVEASPSRADQQLPIAAAIRDRDEK